MPVFFQHDIDTDTKLAIWKIDEDEAFFLQHVPLQREITHPNKRLQHLAGRYLLQYLFADFPISLIKIADTRKPFLENEAYHFSISHCSNYAAALVSKTQRVGVDIEVPTHKVQKIQHKFLQNEEWLQIHQQSGAILNGKHERSLPDDYKTNLLTLLWSSKEAMFKWWGLGDVDFKTVLHIEADSNSGTLQLTGTFHKATIQTTYPVQWKKFNGLVLAWVVTSPHLV